MVYQDNSSFIPPHQEPFDMRKTNSPPSPRPNMPVAETIAQRHLCAFLASVVALQIALINKSPSRMFGGFLLILVVLRNLLGQ